MMIVAAAVILRLLHRDRMDDVLLRGVLSVVVAVGTTAGVGVVVGVAAHQGEQIAAAAPLRSFWGGCFEIPSSIVSSDLFARKIGCGRGGQHAERDREASVQREKYQKCSFALQAGRIPRHGKHERLNHGREIACARHSIAKRY